MEGLDFLGKLGKKDEEIKEITNVKQNEEAFISEQEEVKKDYVGLIKALAIELKDSSSREEANIEIKKLRQFFHALEMQLQ